MAEVQYDALIPPTIISYKDFKKFTIYLWCITTILVLILVAVTVQQLELHTASMNRTKIKEENNFEISLQFEKNFNLTNETFKKNNAIENILLHGGSIVDISCDTFDNLQLVRNITLRDSKLPYFRLCMFENLSGLKVLSLRNDSIASLPDGIFGSLNYLIELDLSENILKIWSPKYYNQGLRRLEILNLSGNKFTWMDYDSYSGLNLTTLILSRNKIKRIDYYPHYIPSKLTYLDLSWNLLKNNNQTQFDPFKRLEVLNLDGNKFYQYPAISSRYLKRISMRNNSIIIYNYINNSIWNSASVLNEHILPYFNHTLVLDYSDNQFTCDYGIRFMMPYIHPEEQICPNCIRIELGSTRCDSPPFMRNRVIENLTKDEVFYSFHPDEPEGCNSYIFPLNGTLVVDCSDRNLTKPPKSFKFEPFIVVAYNIDNCILNLNNNRISKFGINLNLENVTELYLANNNLKDVTWLPKQIQVLNLKNNSLNSIDDELVLFLENSTRLRRIDLHKNPWICNCSRLLFRNLTSNLHQKLVNKGEVLCMMCAKHDSYIMFMTNILPFILFGVLIMLMVVLMTVRKKIFGDMVEYQIHFKNAAEL